MKKLFFLKFLGFTLFLLSQLSLPAWATHIVSGELTYQCIGTKKYQFTLVVYSECGSTAILEQDYPIRYFSPSQGIPQTEAKIFNVNQITEIEIPIYCNTVVTNCNDGTERGVKKVIYSGTVDLSSYEYATDWTFYWVRAARSEEITTLLAPDQEDFYIQVIEAANIGYDHQSDSLTTTTRWIAQSDQKGTFGIDYQLNKKQYLVIAKEGYRKAWVALDTIRAKAQDTTWIEVLLDKIPEKQPETITTEKETETRQREDFNEELSGESIKEGGIFVLKNLYFDTGQSDIKMVSHEELDRLVRFLKNHPNVTIEIAGHTDGVGDDAHNLQLSQDRAEAVKIYLMDQGIAEVRMEAKGYGEHQPIADNNTEAGRQQNRRTEVKITGSASQ